MKVSSLSQHNRTGCILRPFCYCHTEKDNSKITQLSWMSNKPIRGNTSAEKERLVSNWAELSHVFILMLILLPLPLLID